MTKRKTNTVRENSAIKPDFDDTPFDEAAYRDKLVSMGIALNAAIEEVASKPAKVRAAKKTQKKNLFSPEAKLAKPKRTSLQSIIRVLPDSSLVEMLPITIDTPAQPAEVPVADTLIEPAKAFCPAKMEVYDYRNGDLPARVRELIEAHLAIEAEDARSAGTIGYMTRALAIATLPHRRQTQDRFVRRNGDFTLTMLTAHPEGLPFGTIPRLLLTWVCNEVVLKRERVLNLGSSLAAYLHELGLHSTGGKRGDITRLKHAMTTLFGAIISCRYEGRDSWALQNVLLVDKVEWWTPQNPKEAGEWQSRLQLSQPFYNECIDHPIPIDMRAIKVLRSSPLALDIYVWLTHRMSYLSKRTTIPWVSLSGQFGAGYAINDQGLRDFKRAFLRELKHVVTIYPEARLSPSKNGLVLYSSPTHVIPASSPPQN